ncbi:MAG TPA: glycosyltransferase family 4 protein [Iamia sp.]|nr:glycosyltransferase family 4 protein [Iamia sp.]
MARVLWLTTQPPDLTGGGGNIRQAHLLAGVAADHEVHLAVVGHLEDDRLRASLARVTELSASPARPAARGLRRRAEHLRSVVQTEAADCVDQAAARARLARVAVEEADVDVVCVEHLALTPLLPARRTARWVATLHHLPSVQAEQAGAVSAGPAARWYWRREAGKARRRERWTAAAYDLTVVCSADDAARLPPGAAVVPNGADLDRVPATPVPETPVLVFVGSLDYRPNVDGARWLCREVLPIVRAARPNAVIRLVGHQPAPAVRELAGPGVEVHGDVPSVDPFLLDARVAVVPLRIGSGTRLKALEAMAARRPVVGTAVGLAGLGVTDGVDALVADDAEAFAGAVLDLLDDDARVARLVAGGRRLVEDRYGWPAIARRYADLLASSAATPVRG